MTATPTWASDTAVLYTGDAADTLAALLTGSAHCVVTSPPYWGLRDYGTGTWRGGDARCAHSVGRGTNTAHSRVSGSVDYPASVAHRGGDPRVCRRCGAIRVDRQYGLEPTPEDYVDTLRRVFTELRRVLDPAGTVWLNLGDSYSSEPPGHSRHAMRHSTLAGRGAAEQARESVRRADVDRTTAVPRKNLLGMPWRVALALQADGWILRNAIVWAKRNPMPESVRDRLSTTYEFVFLLTTGPRYHFDLDPIRVPLGRREALTEGITIGGTPGVRTGAVGASARRRGGVYGAKYRAPAPFAHAALGEAIRPTGRRHDAAHPRGKNSGDVWHLSTRPQRRHGGEAHFATFPIDIPLRCIAAGCPPEGVVLDPFSGAATTGLAALHLGRRYIGVDLNPDYTILAQRRLTAAAHQRGHRPASESSPTPEAIMTTTRARPDRDPQPALRCLSLGAGIQSSTVLLLACEGMIPRFDVALFADTGWEPRAVYENLTRLRAHAATFGIPVRTVSAGNIREDALDPAHRFVSMPLHVLNPDGTRGLARRQCTGEYKIAPLKKAARKLLGYPHPQRVPRGVYVEQAIGISTDEFARAKDSGVQYLRNVFPLLDLGWDRARCIEYLAERGFADTVKSACVGCPFHGNAGWRWIRDHDPDGWAEAVAFDKAIRDGYPHATKQGQELRGRYFLHRSCQPLDHVDLDAPATRRRHLRLVTAGSAHDGPDVVPDVDEDGDPDGCSPWSCRSGEPVTATGTGERAA